MSDILESEAQLLLNQQLQCSDYGDWTRKGAGYLLGAGLTDQLGHSSGLVVELRCRWIDHGRGRSYQFTVLRRHSNGFDRVYQLEVNKSPKRLKDQHKRTHEHVGDSRATLPQTWNSLPYDQLLRYFCSRTNIVFVPMPALPSGL
jgi:hypothetical protein